MSWTSLPKKTFYPIGISWKFSYAESVSAEDMEKATELSGSKVIGLELKLKKAKVNRLHSRRLFIKTLPYKVTQEELK